MVDQSDAAARAGWLEQLFKNYLSFEHRYVHVMEAALQIPGRAAAISW